MMRKLWVGLLVLAFVLGPVSGFWSKPVVAHTEDRRLLCAAWPWSDEDWNKATPPPTSNQDSTYSSTNPVQPKPQNLRQKPKKSSWSRLQLFLFNLKLLFGSK